VREENPRKKAENRQKGNFSGEPQEQGQNRGRDLMTGNNRQTRRGRIGEWYIPKSIGSGGGRSFEGLSGRKVHKVRYIQTKSPQLGESGRRVNPGIRKKGRKLHGKGEAYSAASSPWGLDPRKELER